MYKYRVVLIIRAILMPVRFSTWIDYFLRWHNIFWESSDKFYFITTDVFLYSGMTCWLIFVGALCHIRFHSMWPFFPPVKTHKKLVKIGWFVLLSFKLLAALISREKFQKIIRLEKTRENFKKPKELFHKKIFKKKNISWEKFKKILYWKKSWKYSSFVLFRY